jgi:membrane-bound inhibitor of C-type lysozyme
VNTHAGCTIIILKNKKIRTSKLSYVAINKKQTKKTNRRKKERKKTQGLKTGISEMTTVQISVVTTGSGAKYV